MPARKWIVRDRYGHEIYLIEERWQHALEHDDMSEALLDIVLDTLKTGRRRQNPLDPRKYTYSKSYAGLPFDNTRMFVVVRFGLQFDESGKSHPNNFVLTAYMD